MTPLTPPPGYAVVEAPPPAADFLRLRVQAGMRPRSAEAAARGLPRSLYAVHVVLLDGPDAGLVVAMGRIVGDGALNFEVVDVAVQPAHQGRGLGRLIMAHLMAYLHANALPGSLVSLIADVPALYEKFGFRSAAPAVGMELYLDTPANTRDTTPAS